MEIYPTSGHPIVYGEKIICIRCLLQLLVYGHYDVQPVIHMNYGTAYPLNQKLKTDIHPDGAIFARGACDDGANVYAFKAFEARNRTNNQLVMSNSCLKV